MFRFGDIARDNKGTVFNLVLSFCMILFGPYYIKEIKLLRELDHTNFFIAFLLLTFLVLEPYALFLKINSVYANDHLKRSFTGRYVFLWIAHIIVTVQALLLMAFAMPGGLKFINIPLFWVIGTKEFLFLFYLLNRQMTDEPDKNGKPYPPPKKIAEKKVFMADVILSGYAFLVFGITWQSVGASGFLHGIMNELADSYIFRIFTYLFMFLMIYYPIRMGQFIDEWLNNLTQKQKRNYRLSLIVTLVSCIGPLFVGGRIPNKDEINLKSRAGKTPLIEAIEYEPLPYLQRLIDAGADVNAQDTTGRTALHYAAKGGRYEALELLLKNGANPDIQRNNGGTALALTAGFHHLEALEILLKYKANPNLTYDDGGTALMEAAHQGFFPAVELLLKNKADPNQKDTAGWCAIAYFSHVNNTGNESGRKILELLISKTDLSIRDNKRHTLVWHATRYNGWPYTDVARELMKAGSAVDSSDIINRDGYNIITERLIEREPDSSDTKTE